MLSELLRFPVLLRQTSHLAWREACELVPGERAVPEETPVAFVYGGCSYAVMMATPDDLEEFAIGFSLTEGIVAAPDEIEELAVRPRDNGVILDMAVAPARMEAFWSRRRFLAGPSGCGLCGLESIEQALKPCRPVAGDLRVSAAEVIAALQSMSRHQVLNRQTRAVHAAAFWHPELGLALLREDVGRHNALDKLAGALARRGIDAGEGAVLLTSRISVELVQKAAAIGAAVMVAVSAPTALAVRVAAEAGITLVAVARADGFEIFTRPERVLVDGREEAAP